MLGGGFLLSFAPEGRIVKHIGPTTTLMDADFQTEISRRTAEIDARWQTKGTIPASYALTFEVPLSHARHETLASYIYSLGSIADFTMQENDLIIIDTKIYKSVESIVAGHFFRVLEPLENETKTLDYLEGLLKDLSVNKYTRVVAIGGGLILSICGYIAEKIAVDLILFPTTIIAMCDTCVGGKVRVNSLQDGMFHKNAYRSYYEPNAAIVDQRFLESLSEHQIRYGLAKIIKHALYQSEGLHAYLLSEEFRPFEDYRCILKAILWTIELKQACIAADPYLLPNGSDGILRAAHDISDHLEEQSGLIMSHGEATLRAMEVDLGIDRVRPLYKKLGIYFKALN